MTATNTAQNSARPIQRDASTHLFTVGQTVRLRGGYGVSSARFGDIYHVTATLPPSGTSLQYRIRNDREQYERVAMEDSLELALAAKMGEAETLLEFTFDVSAAGRKTRAR